jgi:opacity protein-like surface antigen
VLRSARGADEDQTNDCELRCAGLGVSYVIAGHWSARLDYLRIEHAGDGATTGKYNAAILAVGASYTF